MLERWTGKGGKEPSREPPDDGVVMPKFDKSRVVLVDVVPLRPVGWRKFRPKLRVEAVRDFAFKPEESWGPVSLILGLEPKGEDVEGRLWAFMNFDVDTAVRLIAAIARACAVAFPMFSTRDILSRAMKYAYGRGW